MNRARLVENGIGLTIAACSLLLASAVWTPVRVTGGSMTPALYPGDVVLVSLGREVRAGDIVLVKTRSRGRYLHRVVGLSADGTYRLRGDANNTADLTPVRRSEVDGVVVRVLPAGAWLAGWKRVWGLRYTCGSNRIGRGDDGDGVVRTTRPGKGSIDWKSQTDTGAHGSLHQPRPEGRFGV